MSTPAPRRTHAGRRVALGLSALAATALLVPAAAGAQTVKVGSVYTETNGNPNKVVAFDRFADGTLAEVQRVATGGIGGLGPSCPGAPCPITDSQGAVALNATGTLLFAVNAGSDSISSFRVTLGGLQRVGLVASDGDYPQSLTIHDDILYVLNQQTGSIAGFSFTATGAMTLIPGSARYLTTHGPGGQAAQIGFDRTGRNLVVTERATNIIDTFAVTNGVAGPAVAHPSAAIVPFGFAFDGLSHLVVSDALSQVAGAASSYLESPTGGLTPLDTESTNGGAPCWVVITPNNRFVYITDTTTKDVAAFALGTDGSLTFLGNTPILNTPPGPVLFPTDEALSRDGRFLYVLVPSVFGPDISRIDAFSISTGGGLTLVASTPENMPAGVSGLAAR